MARATQTAGRARNRNFRYVAATAAGKIVRGTIKAPSEVAAQDRLVQRGQTPVSLETAPPTFSLESQLPGLFKVKQRDVVNFSRQLATLLESGITLLPALQLLASQSSMGPTFRRILVTMAQDLGVGRSFSQAIARHDKVFDEVYSRTIAVGEQTGRLETVLREVAEHMEKAQAFSKKVSGALTYPIIVLVVGGLVGVVLVTVALPPLVDLFKSMSIDLPLPTRILIGTAGFMGTFKIQIFATILSATLFSLWFFKQRRGRRVMDRMRLTFPMWGKIYHMAELARLCRTVAVMLGAGISLQDVVEALPRITANVILREALFSVQRGLVLGQGLTYPMSLHSVFPPLLLQMVRVGEESNTLETNLRVLSEFYETTAGEQATALLALLQPAITLVMAFVAGFIALSVIMPMYSITSGF